MVLTTAAQNAAKQKIIYGVKRGKIPATLRATAPPQKRQVGDTSCHKEMEKLFTCWTENKYKDVHCSEEIGAFMSCSNEAMAQYKKTGGKIGVKYDQQLLNEVLRKHTIIKKRAQTEKRKFLNID